ncbi:hypothetical protein C8R31_102124 [Nitrosospira sp. Nsp2]|uniref:hypothetical protein n=1 Tax=Nitrosospira sp. Nsp2 TaxID=136548 RepID=UPI000D321934|nr:hypothetical protein [Nitrosospira sp. Nsp2]PTR16110.1 hypothetical protein C8R31_102124 [Nitrosospira sp. Nsp2]
MHQFVTATKAAVAQGNWYAALAIALTMPDICGRTENPSKNSRARFVDWYDRFLLKRYQANIGPNRALHTFLSGLDCYALRCAFLHQGEFGIDDQRARQALERFHFDIPRQGSFIHMNHVNNVLQLQVDRFCLDVTEAVEQWLIIVAGDKDIQARLAKLASIG